MEDLINQPPLPVRRALQVPKWTFGISFLLGTFLFAYQAVDHQNDFIMYLGFGYVILAVIVNLLILIALTICSFIYKEYQNKILINSSIILLNIPVVIAYITIMFVI